MNIAEFIRPRSKDGQKDKMVIIGKEVSLSTSDEYEKISLDPGSHNLAGVRIFLKVSKIGEIIYCAEGISNRRAYRRWRNMIYTSG